MDIKERIAGLGKYPEHLGDLLDMGHEIATLGGLYVEQNAWLIKALALAREWINGNSHQRGCPWDGLTGSAASLTPPCTCGRDALLAALEVPR